MSRTAAKFTQADLNRSVKAVKNAGAGMVELLPDGIIRITINSTGDNKTVQVEPEEVIL